MEDDEAALLLSIAKSANQASTDGVYDRYAILLILKQVIRATDATDAVLSGLRAEISALHSYAASGEVPPGIADRLQELTDHLEDELGAGASGVKRPLLHLVKRDADRET